MQSKQLKINNCSKPVNFMIKRVT